MSTRDELAEALRGFCDSCTSNDQLRKMNRGWDRRIGVWASDLGAGFTIDYQDSAAELFDGLPDEPDLNVESDAATLVSIFSGAVTPAEPYADGSLRVLGNEDDVLRLDFISQVIWGE